MEQTCPNCNVDVDVEELKRNYLRCPTCGFDLSESKSKDDPDEDEDEDKEEEKADEEEDEDDED